MIQDIHPHRFQNQFACPGARPDDALLCFDQGAVLLRRVGGEVAFPSCGEAGLPEQALRFLFAIDEQRFFLYCGATPLRLAGYAYEQESFRDALPLHLAFAGATAFQLARWYEAHRFCGCCGRRMRHSGTERALVCDCGNIVYPKIAPAVIIALTDGDKLLLTRYAGRPYRRWALIAGYCEIGETVEETVRREVMEEVGIAVRDLVYYKSQPWPFTDTLLFGFFCHVDGAAEIRLDHNELAEAVWFRREDIPDSPGNISLTQEMIELFRTGREPR